MALAGKAIDILQHHDGVVHDHAHAHGDAAQTHHVQSEVKDIHQDEHGQDADGHGDGDGHGGAPAAQEQEHHDGRQDYAQHNVLHGGFHRQIDIVRGQVRGGVLHGGVVRLQLRQTRLDCVGNGHLVGAGLLGDLEQDAVCAVHGGNGIRVRGLQSYGGHFRETYGPAGGQGQDHVGYVVHRLKLGVGTHRQSFGTILHVAAGVDEIFRSQEL